MNILNHLFASRFSKILIALILVIVLLVLGLAFTSYNSYSASKQLSDNLSLNNNLALELKNSDAEVTFLKDQDQYKINQDLKSQISDIKKVYKSAVDDYEQILDFKASLKKPDEFDKNLAAVFHNLADFNYDEATKSLQTLDTQIKTEKDNQAAAVAKAAAVVVVNVPVSNDPPGSGFSTQKVHTDQGDFTVNLIAADLGSNKVIIDTASDSDCVNDCPAFPLATFVSRSGAWAGINGAFFCPSTYPSCAGKTNSFDTLIMNKNKYYFNSANNVYSTVPAVIFSSGSVRFVSQSLQWGRDTSVDGVIANYPMLVQNDQIAFTGSDSEPKFSGAGARCFIANKGNTVYMGVISGATMTQAAVVLKAMGMNNALNMDEGGSTALWYGGHYIQGPGRDLANGVLFVKK